MIAFDLSAKIQDNLLLVNVSALSESECECAYYFIKDGERIKTKWYPANFNQQFCLESPGAYYVTCFIRSKNNPAELISRNTQLFDFPSSSREVRYNAAIKKLLEGEFQIHSKLIDDFLFCEIQPVDIEFTDLEFAFYLMEGFEKVSVVSYSPYNAVKFELKKAGIYTVKCFVRRNDEIVIKTAPLYGYKMECTIPEHGEMPLASPSYIPLEYPYADFCLVLTQDLIQDNAFADIEQQTGLQIKKKTWLSSSHIYLIAAGHVVNQNTILSGMINEGPHLIFGQKDAAHLDALADSDHDITTMIGKYAICRYNGNAAIITCDFFSANAVFYFWDGSMAIISNRLNLILKLISSLKIETKINKEYIAASMTFNDGMISGTNFLTELAIKNLYVLPLNDYLELTEDGLRVTKKNINYCKIAYDDKKYRDLLYRAKDDIINKLKNIERSPDITHYKMSLSGGFDSRLNLAILLNNNELLKKTAFVTKDVSSAKDLDVSIMLTNRFGLKYAKNSNYQIKYEELTADTVIDRYRNFNNGLYHTIQQLPGCACISSVDNQTINFVGAFGETMRSHYYMSTRKLVGANDRVEQLVDKLVNKLDCHISAFGDKDFYQAFCKEISCTPGASDYEKFDNIFSFHYLRYHFNDLINRLQGDGFYYSLFMSKYLFEASRMLTMEERCCNKIALDMCYILYAEVLCIPFSSYGSKDEDLTKDKWGNVIFDPNDLPKIELDNDRSQYEQTEHENNAKKYMCTSEATYKEYCESIYAETIKLYSYLRGVESISMYFDDHMYWYIELVKMELSQLLRIFSKLCGIYDQIVQSN